MRRSLAVADRGAFDAASAPEPWDPPPRKHLPHREAEADPFGLLDIAGARHRRRADVVTSLLHEGPPVPRPSRSLSVRDDRDSSIDGARGRCALFEQWHEEFVRVVRDPGALAGRAGSQCLAEPGGSAAPTWAQLNAQGARFSSPLDIFRARDSIDRVIEGFDRLDGPDLLAPGQPAEVLSAFAPELVGHAGGALPGLTRREHHDMATDSPVRIGARVGGHGDSTA